MSRLTNLSQTVQRAELPTRFDAQSGCTIHTYTNIGDNSQASAVAREEYWKRQRLIGGGSFGRVWLEKCIRGQQRQSHVRAVKEVVKVPNKSRQNDYRRELEAISKFSHDRYERSFVKSFGWYETNDAVFIAMEYFKFGDLHQYLEAHPPLPESGAQEVTLQLLEGLGFMHQNGFAHRDMKPRNILVRSRPPESWWVKLGDFGISKRAADNLGATSTVKGTLKYMAPELLGLGIQGEEHHQHDPMAADIWATGEIAFQMLTQANTFDSLGLLLAYLQSESRFPAGFMRQRSISGDGVDLIHKLMKPRSRDRLTASRALLHRWFEAAKSRSVKSSALSAVGRDELYNTTGDLAVRNRTLTVPDVMSPSSMMSSAPTPAGDWTTVTAAVPRSLSPSTVNGIVSSETVVGTSRSRMSKTDFSSLALENYSMEYDPARGDSTDQRLSHVQPVIKPKFFVLKSRNETNIETSNAHGIWCSHKPDNTRLSTAYNKADGEVYLIFSVNESRQFCGVAKMTSPWKRDVVDIHWEDGSWEGGYTVQWLSWTPVHFKDVEHLKQKELGAGIPITRIRFVSEICKSTGLEMMRRSGLAHMFSQTGPQQLSRADTIGSLGVGNLNLATRESTLAANHGENALRRSSVSQRNAGSLASGALGRISVDPRLQTLQSSFNKLMDQLPSHSDSRSEDVFQWVRFPWDELMNTLSVTISHFLQPLENQNVSPKTLDDITNIIHMIPEWDNRSRNLAKRRAYEDIARAWAAFIYERVRDSYAAEFRRGGWRAKIMEHNDMSKGLMRAAREALVETESTQTASSSTATTQRLAKKRPASTEADNTERSQYKALFRR